MPTRWGDEQADRARLPTPMICIVQGDTERESEAQQYAL